MKGFVIGATIFAWICGLVSLYLAWGVRLQGLKMFLPLFGFTLALIVCAFVGVVCLWQLCRVGRTREEIVVFLVMGGLAVAPLLWVARQYVSYLGPADQFLLKILAPGI